VQKLLCGLLKVMDVNVLTEYLSSLLNRPVTAAQSVSLSSAQRARFIGWLESNGMAVDSLTIPAILDVAELGRQLTVAPAERDRPRSSSLPLDQMNMRALRGIGIDIQSVAELVKPESRNDLKGDVELCAIFTLRELSYAEAKADPAQTLAGIFAAKEAARKADPVLLRRPLTDIEILPDADGAPQLPGFAISISHSSGIAIAIAIPVGEPMNSVSAANIAQTPGHAPPAPGADASAGAADRQPLAGRRFAMVVLAFLTGAGAAGTLAWLHALAR
jgi:phosphopantetheine--protein transferase-like protein